MLTKKNRANRKTVEKIFKNGKFLNSPNLSFKFLLDRSSSDKNISFTVPKNVAKTAVKRNLLRRRGYRILKKHFEEFPSGLSAVFILKNPTLPSLETEQEMKTILHKIK